MEPKTGSFYILLLSAANGITCIKILYIENNREFQNLEAVLGHRPPSSPLWPRGPLSHALSEEPGQPEDVADGDL